MEARKAVAKKYDDAFSKLDFIEVPPDGEGNAWHLYLMRIKPDALTISRDDFVKELQSRGIGVSVHFIPLFHFTYWKKLYPEFRAEHFPNAQKRFASTISIPLWPGMTSDMTDSVIEAVLSIGAAHHA